MGQESLSPGVSAAGGNGWDAPIEAAAAVLELAASEHPELLEFQVHVLANGTMSFALDKLASSLDVPRRQLAPTVLRACKDLDRLERRKGTWREPAKILDEPNLAALFYVGSARLERVSIPPRRQRLERVVRKVERAYGLARSRAWIEAFIGPLPQKQPSTESADA